MSRREFTSQKALQDHAEQTGKVCVMEGIALRHRQLNTRSWMCALPVEYCGRRC